jgi:uncharacterized protein (TIGR02001 family)
MAQVVLIASWPEWRHPVNEKGSPMNALKKSLLSIAVASACAAPSLALAQAAAPSPHSLTGNVGLFSQYIFRGLTQTDGRAALQGGLDYAHASGFYAGIWASNVSWLADGYAGVQPGITRAGSYSLEVDTYLGFKFPVGDFTFDVGFLRYNYPGRAPVPGFLPGTGRADTNELYAGVSWKWLTFKYSHVLGDFFGIQDAGGSYYLDLTGTFPLADTGAYLVAHVGRQEVRGTNATLWAASGCTNDCLSYTDWRLGVTRELFGLNWSLMYTSTNSRAVAPDGTTAVWNNLAGRNIGRSTWTVGVQKTF